MTIELELIDDNDVLAVLVPGEQGAPGTGGGGTPDGGAVGDLLAKASNDDQDLIWASRAGLPISTATQEALNSKASIGLAAGLSIALG